MALSAVLDFKEKDVPGRAVLFPNKELESPLPYSLADNYRGAAIHLRGTKGLADNHVFEKLEVKPTLIKSHPGDRFIQLLDTLSNYPQSLLIWSDVSRREIQLVDLLSAEIPQNLAVVLISPDDVSASPKVVVEADQSDKHRRAEQALAKPDPVNQLERLNNLMDADQFRDAVSLWGTLKAQYSTWDSNVQLRYQINGYWSFIRVGPKERAEDCVQAVEALDEYEGLLLRGNFAHREGLYDAARLAYTKAMQKANNQRDEGRARLELAYLYFELGDSQLSEEYYKRSIELLEKVDDESKDWRWRSPMGRVLRDFAELLISDATRVRGDPARAQECERYLNRAMAIHAFDDRLNQVAAALRTQGKLAKIQEQWAKAEGAFWSAASIFTKIGNPAGWAATVREVAELSYARKQYDQCLVILQGCFNQLNKKYPKDYKSEKGLTAFQMARVYWNLGKIVEAKQLFGRADLVVMMT